MSPDPALPREARLLVAVLASIALAVFGPALAALAVLPVIAGWRPVGRGMQNRRQLPMHAE
ncbi:hypothetical protein PE066_11915 [Ramlibacter tataouinensis]|uniref:hypothetical protein n=1 Tax=Ramlibacter tataouinensis TaxID=94132 RepID=UPI0022F3DB1D|nr:hypothetical protein [Ramlibacter tataouinensis]WBY00185.1 hypothetical protein PE066_11915 [Ramlibacter tataouinensis]